jgi:pimeloyl-ACP methyl ester carboxylesterase
MLSSPRAETKLNVIQRDKNACVAQMLAVNEKHGCIDYDERGQGPTVVLVPGSCSTGAAWRPVISQWHDNFRCVTTSLLGYGGTAERRTGPDTDISEESQVVESVITRAGSPVHLVGHSFGGLVALDVALRKRTPLLSLTILEAPAAQLLHNMGEEQHYRAFRAMTASYFAAFYRGDAAAIETMIDFYGGAGTFAAWPERVRDYAISTTHVNVRDWANVYRFDLTPARLAAVDIPTVVVFGGKSHPAAQRANRLLAQCIPHAAVHAMAGAAHFMISTHPAETARHIAPHILSVEQSDRRVVA